MTDQDSAFRDRLNSYKVEKMLHDFTSKSDEYLKTEGCGGELRKLESNSEENVVTCNSWGGEDVGNDENQSKSRPKLYRRQSSIVGFDSEHFPFKNLVDFLPNFRIEELDVRWCL